MAGRWRPRRHRRRDAARAAGRRARLVDELDRDVPDGEPGSLLTRGPYTPRGYHKAAEQNARAFTDDDWYRSGDICRRTPDSNLIVEGRDKDMINRGGGEKISAEEVENLVVYQLPGVAQVAAVSVPDRELGSGSASTWYPASA